MSVPSTDLKHKYQGTGSQTVWPFTFRIFEKTDIIVKKLSGIVETTLVLDVDYTVSNFSASSGGGDVTYPITGSALPITDYILIKPNFDYSQELVLENQNTFPPRSVESALDRLAMQIKQIADKLSMSLQLSDAYDGSAEDFIQTIENAASGLITAYSGTSVSSVAVGTGAKTFTTQADKSWSVGQRVRVALNDVTKIMEGPITSYSGTTLVINADFTSGSGTGSNWVISIAGERGAAGAGSGDLLAAQNLNDLANKATAFSNIKQNATTAATGVMRFATQPEVAAGVVTNAAVTPETLATVLPSGGTNGLIPIKTVTVSSPVSSVDFVNGSGGVVLDGTYKAYMVVLTGILSSTNNVALWLRTSTNAGASYDSGASDYVYGGYDIRVSTDNAHNSGADTKIVINEKCSTVTALHGKIDIYQPSIASYPTFGANTVCLNSDANTQIGLAVGVRSSLSDVDALRFLMSSGNIESGTFTLYGSKDA